MECDARANRLGDISESTQGRQRRAGHVERRAAAAADAPIQPERASERASALVPAFARSPPAAAYL